MIKSTSPAFEKKFTWDKNKNFDTHNLEIFEEYNKQKINLLDFETKFKKEFNTKIPGQIGYNNPNKKLRQQHNQYKNFAWLFKG